MTALTASRWRTWRTLCLALLACLVLAGCSRVTLFSDLDERQANEVMAALLASGVKVDKRSATTGSGWQIRVDQGDFPYAMQVLQSRGLPRQQYMSMCEVFRREGFASSAREEQARYQCSLEQELARTLSGYAGVADARVHIALPDRDPLGGQAGNASASVVIFEQPGSNVRNEEHHIKVVVKDAVPGLEDVNQVSIKFNTVAAPGDGAQVQRSGGAPAVMSAINPVVVAGAVALVAILALLVAFGGRLRQRLRGPGKPDGRVWNG